MTFKKIFITIALILFVSVQLHSQEKKDTKRIYSLSHPIKFGQENIYSERKEFKPGIDSFKVVAILVQFEEDSDPRTTGNGLFDLSNKYYNPATQTDTVIDSPPYDSAYFADHLKFLKNYFTKSSKGKLNISYDLYGQVINLPHQMQYYSPQVNESNVKLGYLYQDAWARADSFINLNGYNESNTAFVIFHAGAGRDVDLSSIFGYDPTPYDIPSVYLGLKNLQSFFGSNYTGIQSSGGFNIQNSLIIPSTELRELQLTSGNFLIELGMNGILAANFGSYLGLPDLFNTSTGVTAIGRFGLMDGQSLFSYNGIFPPEPSAWEKIYLGWVDPVVISSGSRNIKIPTSSKNNYRDSTIYKVLMSAQEYFLIENRNRDPQNNGQTIYTRNRAFNDSTVYLQDEENGFYYSNSYTSLYKLNGNLTDVETFDWSLPGLINSTNNYKGGILIWHIDESVINANISNNTINNNIDHRGVDLEEAKGAQEIGVTFSTPFGNVTGDGTPVDYWYLGNHEVPANIYRNSFNPTSYPNSLSYSLANNNIYIQNFSSIDTLMTLSVSIGSNQISPISNFPKFVGVDTSGNSQAIAFDYSGDAGEEIFINSNNNVYGFKSNGNAVDSAAPDGLILSNFGKYVPASNTTVNHKYIIALSDTGIAFKNNLGTNNYSLGNGISSCPPFINENTDFAYVGKTNGQIIKINADGFKFKIDSAAGSIKQFSVVSADTFNYITNAFKYAVTGNITSPNSTDLLIINNNNEFILNGKKININYNISGINNSPVLADINSDRKQEIIFSNGDAVFAINANGVLLDNFPADFNDSISSGVSVADINNDNVYDLIFATTNGDLYAYGVNGIVVSGFPVKIGLNTTSTPALANLNDTLGIVAISGDGYLYGFKTNLIYNQEKVLWKNFLKDKYLSNNNFISGNSPTSYSGKLPADKVYNWPNPVYDGQTFIRYYINGNASSINIKILDLSGELVTTLQGTALSNADNEVVWNVSGVQSGIYYGVVEGNIDGSSETQVIKIAIVK
jgi:M6 family metalloprotease-like protein